MAAPNQGKPTAYQAGVAEFARRHFQKEIAEERNKLLASLNQLIQGFQAEYETAMNDKMNQIRTEITDPALQTSIIDDNNVSFATFVATYVRAPEDLPLSRNKPALHTALDAAAGSSKDSENPAIVKDSDPKTPTNAVPQSTSQTSTGQVVLSQRVKRRHTKPDDFFPQPPSLPKHMPAPTAPSPSVLPTNPYRFTTFFEVKNNAWMYLGKDRSYYATFCIRVVGSVTVRHWFRTDPFESGEAERHLKGKHRCHDPLPPQESYTDDELMLRIGWRVIAVVMEEGRRLTADMVEASNQVAAEKRDGPGREDDE